MRESSARRASRIAVLTGDLIGSSDYATGEIDRAFAALSSAAEAAAAWHHASLRFTRNRGDGWQVCLAQTPLALRTALFLRARLAALGGPGTRIAIAEGDGRPADNGNLNRATGPAFTLSGRTLDALSGHEAMRHASGGPMGAATRLADHISQGWTQVQAETIAIFLPPNAPTRAEASRRLEKSRQAVDQALAAAGYPAISDALRMIEEDDA
jgi:hypothetical protein